MTYKQIIRKFAYTALAVYNTTLPVVIVAINELLLPTGSVQKLNSYIIQSSCRGGMQRVIRSDTAHSAHIHAGYQHNHWLPTHS